MMKKLFVYLFLPFLLILNVNAFLISPPKIEVQFQPGVTLQYTITLFNNREEDINLETYVKYNFLSPQALPSLNNSVTLSTPIISFTSSELIKNFTATITLPSSIPEGLHDIRIGAVEEAVSGVVGSRSANEVRLLIIFGKIQATTTIRRNRTLEEQAPVQQGKQPTSTPGLIVEQKPGFSLQVVTTFVISFLFLILLTLFFTPIMLKSRVYILSLKTEHEKLDDVVKIEAIIRNKTLQVIDNVYLDIQIIDDESNIIKTINIGPIKLKPRYDGIIQRVWEGKGIKRGKYKVRAMLYHHKKAVIKQQPFQLT